ncbi:hypothetical protein LTR16_004007 [Cryomyces antarcticus]|uniref:Uncharacterized protein n=1 Tax=Cryomyces antarcticus TaxID=329879 RepID=A0ABR0KS44_9PEZI|nr:hypothetical protein LTR39_001573 [Cryomyces antarcticus]KAK5122684.1 hypothetical protein LTR16_004007 [Cryomyces antarcticus]
MGKHPVLAASRSTKESREDPSPLPQPNAIEPKAGLLQRLTALIARPSSRSKLHKRYKQQHSQQQQRPQSAPLPRERPSGARYSASPSTTLPQDPHDPSQYFSFPAYEDSHHTPSFLSSLWPHASQLLRRPSSLLSRHSDHTLSSVASCPPQVQHPPLSPDHPPTRHGPVPGHPLYREDMQHGPGHVQPGPASPPTSPRRLQRAARLSSAHAGASKSPAYISSPQRPLYTTANSWTGRERTKRLSGASASPPTSPPRTPAVPPTAQSRGGHAEEGRGADAQASDSDSASASRSSRFARLRGGAGESEHPLSARLHGRGFLPRRIGDDERVPGRLWFFAGGMGNRPRGKNLRAQRKRGKELEEEAREQRERKGQPSLLAFMLGARARGGRMEQETGKDGGEAKESEKKESNALALTEVKVVKEEVVMSGALAPADAQA